MKKLIALLLACVMVLGLVACGNTPAETTAAPEAGNDTPETTAPAAEGPEAITLKVWAPQEDQVDANAWLCQMQAAFQAAHPEYAITWDNGVCPEGDAATMVTADPAAAADVYMFANDQLGTLLQAGALAKLGGPFLEQVQNDVSATYVNTVTSTDGSVYGFPVAPNTWFMYYNKAIVGDADLTSMESILEKGIVAFEVKNSWYLPAFFFAAGGTLFGETGTDAAAGVQFGGEVGVNATNAVLDLLANPNFKVDGDGFGNAGLKDGTVAAYFSGSWDYAGLYEALGEDLGAVAAPTVMMNGAPAQLKAYAGSKAVGVNPNAKNMKAAMEFAAFLASADSQLVRFQLRNITPAVTALAENEAVAASIVAAAESATMANTSVAQPTIAEMNPVWGPVGTFGTNLADGSVTAENVAEMVDLLYTQLNEGGL
ncbi:MAG: extracellular solute-binding protein [Oscillospiraceae bacterium]|nr:extracellular solute-binding protein [Oscillospiraceae bacterium]MBR5293466.1 extracellular solute-binding protein [Oscillospiraceae bacterium]